MDKGRQRSKEASQRVRADRLVRLTEVPEGSPVFGGTDVPVQYLLDYLAQIHNLYAFLEDHPRFRQSMQSLIRVNCRFIAVPCCGVRDGGRQSPCISNEDFVRKPSEVRCNSLRNPLSVEARQ